MGSFAKKIGRNKPSLGKATAQRIAVGHKRMKSLDAQAEAIVYQQEGERYNNILNGTYNVMAIYNLHKVFNMPYDTIGKVHRKMHSINSCVETGRVEYYELEDLIVKGTDPANWPIKWKDYSWPDHQFLDKYSVDPDEGRRETLDKLVRMKREGRIDAIMHAMELMYMVALHDVAGFGAKRCKRFANYMRAIRLLSTDEFKHCFKWLCKHGIVPLNWEADILLQKSDEILANIINRKPSWSLAPA